MKAIRVASFGGPEVLRLETVPDPRPGPGQVLVKIHAAGVNPVETYIRAGAYARKPALPYTPGSDGAGVVAAVGPDVVDLQEGDRVYTAGSLTGTYAELALCERRQVHRLHRRLSYEQGAAIGVPYGTAFRALFQRGRGKRGELALIHGASGGVGTAALQLCRDRGLRAAGTAGTERGAELARQQGALECFDHAVPGYETTLLEWTEGRGFDLIVEMLANVNLVRDLALLAPRGRVVVVGSRGAIEWEPRAAMTKDADVLGMSLHNATPQELSEIHAELAHGLSGGALSPVVGRAFPLAEAPKAHEAVMAAGAHGKIVLAP